jgi:hypothetical protein
MGQDKSPLPEIVQQKAWKDQRKPGKDDRPAAEMPEIDIEGLCTGDGQKDRTEHGDGNMRMVDQEADAVIWIDSDQNIGRFKDMDEARDTKR